jgi:RNA polymerase sigma-70 factor (ECF subfamily)
MVEKLRRILMRGLRNILNGRIRDDVDAVVEDFTQEALIKILDSLDSFRGESRFTTWAQKIAVRTAMVEIRRKRWQDVSLEALLDEDDAPQGLAGMSDDGPNPEELTQRQKETIRAFTLHLTHGVPLDELARRFNTNRNAFYKLLHDSRKRLKKLLEAEGITLDDI